ncbi:hypothetical protein ACKS0A_10991 [Histoplasma ohiense]
MLLAKAGAVQVLFQVLCVTTTKAMQALRGSYVDLKKKKKKERRSPIHISDCLTLGIRIGRLLSTHQPGEV